MEDWNRESLYESDYGNTKVMISGKATKDMEYWKMAM